MKRGAYERFSSSPNLKEGLEGTIFRTFLKTLFEFHP